MYFSLIVFNIYFNVICVKKTAVNDLQKFESTLLASHVGTALGFDRLKTTPDRSALGAGCTTTLNAFLIVKFPIE